MKATIVQKNAFDKSQGNQYGLFSQKPIQKKSGVPGLGTPPCTVGRKLAISGS